MAKPARKKAPARPVLPFDPVGVEFKKLYQLIKSDRQFENLDLRPAYMPNLYLSNEIIRAFARLIAQGPMGPTVIKASKDGALAVTQRGGAFDSYERQDHTFAISGAARTTDATLANHLEDTGEDFVAEGIKPGDTVFNITDSTSAFVVAVAAASLELSADIMVTAEDYQLWPCKDFTFSRQVERLDIFTYNGPVDYQLTRDAVQPYGSKIPLFEDSFYSLDFYTAKVRATCLSIVALTPVRSTLFGWFRLED